MFRKTKSRTNLRQRLMQNDDTEDEQPKNGSVVQQQQQPPLKQNHSEKVNKTTENEPPVVTKTNNLLSFDDLEGDDVTDFKIRKKDHNKRLEKLARRAKHLHNKEIDLNYNDDEASTIVLKDIKREKFSPSVHQEKEEEEKPSYSNEKLFDKAIVSEEDDTVRNKFSNSFAGQIPDAQAVYEARKKREKLRRIGAGGRIPIDDVQRLNDKSIARSRLVREDDNDMSDEEDAGRFYSSKSLLKNEEERRRNEQSEFLAVEQGDDEQSDEELARWEIEQMKKGVSSNKVEMLERERERTDFMRQSMMLHYEIPQEDRETLPMDMDLDIDVNDSPLLNSSSGFLSGSAMNITMDGIFSKLKQHIVNRDEALNTKEAELEKIEQNIKENKESIAALEMQKPLLKDRFDMYQEMRIFVRDLLECLNEKLTDIKNLETRMYSIRNNRTQRLLKRRRQDVHDVYDECSAAAAGRSITRTPDFVQRSAEREARRARRRRQRENTLVGISHEEGLSSDDEETKTEIVVREQAVAEITEATRAVFVDTLEDFSHVDRIIARFIDWLAVDEKSFIDAYVQLCIPKLLSLFIRLEMIAWNPLENDELSLHSMLWYRDLIGCGTENANINIEHPAIVSLIPLCIEKVVLLRITDIIRDQWDPLSIRQTQSLVHLLDTLFDECPTLESNSRVLQRILTTIRQRAQNSIDEDLFVPIYSKQAVENPSSGCKLFLDRQFWTAIKLMRSLANLSKIISEEGLKELLLDGIVNRSIVVALQCSIWSDPSMVRKCRAIIKLIPSEWWIDRSRLSIQSLINILNRIADDYKTSSREFSKEIRKAISGEKI